MASLASHAYPLATKPETLRPTQLAPSSSRDAQHYHLDGDCVILVENVVFKIHRFHLTHNSPVFASMFGLPLGGTLEEGLSDESPIVLHGDSAADFRALLKYLYAPVLETQIEAIPLSEMHRIIALARLAHKYAMEAWKAWALQFLTRRVINQSKFGAEDVQALHSLYTQLEDDPMRARLMQSWCKFVEAGELPICDAIEAADAAGDAGCLTELYCTQIRRFGASADLFNPPSLLSTGIPAVHLQRIFAGYCSLSMAWIRFREEPISSYTKHARRELWCTPQQHAAELGGKMRSEMRSRDGRTLLRWKSV
ncbi:hypothetical protein C8R46DRAFT_1190670 [Mycena filopes]|nr:hypothetical protein C8R46DRAFT_1190670 [Mycena filopes]